MKYSTQTSSKSVTSMEAFDLLQATESLNQAHMDLTDSLRNLDEVCEIVDNINKASKMISQYGANAIQILNTDGSLESLLQIPEKMITIEKAQEGLRDAFKSGWEKFKEGIKKAIEAIKDFISKMVGRITDFFKRFSLIKKSYEQAKADDKDAYKKAFLGSVIAKGHYAILNGAIDHDLKGVNKLVDDLCLYSKEIRAGKHDNARQLKEQFDNTSIFDTLENGRFFKRSEGESPVDTWGKCGYTNSDQIFDEVEKAQEFVKMIVTLKTGCIEPLEKFNDTNQEHDLSELRDVISYARKVTSFARVLFIVIESMTSALQITQNSLKTKFGIKDSE